MAFRKFGGIEYHKKNNYVSSNINNNMNLNITDQIGNINTKIVTKSHLDLDGQTMFNVGNVIFANGLDVEQMLGNVDLMNNEAIQSIFTKNNTWSGVNTFTNTTLMSSLEVGTNCQINSNGSISGSSLSTTGPISGSSLTSSGLITGGAISGSSLSTTGPITGGPISGSSLTSSGLITGNILAITGTTGTIDGNPILTSTDLTNYASLIDNSPQSFEGPISAPSLSSNGTITGNILAITGTTGTIDGNPILTSTDLTNYASLIDNSPQSFEGPISTPSFNCLEAGFSGASGPVSLSTNSTLNSLIVKTTHPNTGIVLSNNSQVVSLTCPSTGVLEVGGSLQVGETGGTGIIYCSNINFSEATGPVSLYTNSVWDSLVVETSQPNTGIVLSSNGNDVSLTCPSTGVLEVGGSVTGTSATIGHGFTGPYSEIMQIGLNGSDTYSNLGVTGTTLIVSENISTGIVYCDDIIISGSGSIIPTATTQTITIYNSPDGVTGSLATQLDVTSTLSSTTNAISFPSTLLNFIPSYPGQFGPTDNNITFTMNFNGPIYPSNAQNVQITPGDYCTFTGNLGTTFNLYIFGAFSPSTTTPPIPPTLTSSQIYCTSGNTTSLGQTGYIAMNINVSWTT